MNPLIDITVSVYFEVYNAKIYGGEGSVGYASIQYTGCNPFRLNTLNTEFLDNQKIIIADFLKVSKSDIYVVSREKFEQSKEKQYFSISNNNEEFAIGE